MSGAFYAVTSWLPSKLRSGYLPTRVSQGILLASLVPCALGMLSAGWAMDHGAPAIYMNLAVVTVGTGAGERWMGWWAGGLPSRCGRWVGGGWVSE